MYYAVIMAGGRVNHPKQFLKLTNRETMIQSTVRRINKLIPARNIYIVTNEMYKDIVKQQLPMLKEENILVEPAAGNTAASIGLACAYIEREDEDASMIVLPSDHIIKNDQGFINIVDRAFRKAEKGDNLITLGIKPDYQKTGYVYIKHGDIDKDFCYKVERFVEKPDIKTAKGYAESGNYLWNSGMFIWKVQTIMDSFRQFMPELYSSVVRIEDSLGEGGQDCIIKEEFMKLKNISIDYGVMEKAKNIYVVPCDFGWDDAF